MSSVSVKVPTAKVIELVEAKIAELEKKIADYPKDYAKWQSDFKKYEEEFAKSASKLLSKAIQDSVSISTYTHGSLHKRINVTFNIPADVPLPTPPILPEDPNRREWFKREHISPLDRLQKTLKVLKLTTQETVSASTYSAVMDLI